MEKILQANHDSLHTTVRVFGLLKCKCGNQNLRSFAFVKIEDHLYGFECEDCEFIGGTTCHDSPVISYIRFTEI